MADDELELIAERVMHIRQLMQGLAPEIQGAIIADLLAIFLAGHRSMDGRDEALRKQVLKDIVGTAKKLVPINVQHQDEQLREHGATATIHRRY
jgi:hypothetical protein